MVEEGGGVEIAEEFDAHLAATKVVYQEVNFIKQNLSYISLFMT